MDFVKRVEMDLVETHLEQLCIRIILRRLLVEEIRNHLLVSSNIPIPIYVNTHIHISDKLKIHIFFQILRCF